VLKPAFHYVGYIETTLEELREALINSAFSTRHWWDTSVISEWKVRSHVSLAINGLVRWHLQRMAGNFVEPQEPAANREGRRHNGCWRH
jgi:hypothetical protein